MWRKVPSVALVLKLSVLPGWRNILLWLHLLLLGWQLQSSIFSPEFSPAIFGRVSNCQLGVLQVVITWASQYLFLIFPTKPAHLVLVISLKGWKLRDHLPFPPSLKCSVFYVLLITFPSLYPHGRYLTQAFVIYNLGH